MALHRHVVEGEGRVELRDLPEASPDVPRVPAPLEVLEVRPLAERVHAHPGREEVDLGGAFVRHGYAAATWSLAPGLRPMER